MNIPKQIKVGGHTYNISLVKGEDYSKGRDNWGRTYHSEKKILIDKEIERTQMEQTFIHEMLHCVDQVYNANSLEEEEITRLAEGLYQVLKDNRLIK